MHKTQVVSNQLTNKFDKWIFVLHYYCQRLLHSSLLTLQWRLISRPKISFFFPNLISESKKCFKRSEQPNVSTSQSGGEIKVVALEGQTDSHRNPTEDLWSKPVKPEGNHSVLRHTGPGPWQREHPVLRPAGSTFSVHVLPVLRCVHLTQSQQKCSSSQWWRFSAAGRYFLSFLSRVPQKHTQETSDHKPATQSFLQMLWNI